MEESGEEFWVVVDVLRGFADFEVEFGVVFRDVVDEEDILHPLPALFNRIQLWRVRRKVFEDKPTGMLALKEILCRDVGGEPVPNNHHLFLVKMMMQLNQPGDKILGHARAVHDREVKFHATTCRRCADEAETGLILPCECFAQDRRLADFRPCRAANRRERETAFVHENQDCAEFLRFFSMRCDSSEELPRRSIYAISRPAFAVRVRASEEYAARCAKSSRHRIRCESNRRRCATSIVRWDTPPRPRGTK